MGTAYLQENCCFKRDNSWGPGWDRVGVFVTSACCFFCGLKQTIGLKLCRAMLGQLHAQMELSSITGDYSCLDLLHDMHEHFHMALVSP